MAKSPSIVFQASQTLREAFNEGFGTSRHADKKNAQRDGHSYDQYTKSKIYDDKTYKSSRNTCVAFVKYCRSEHGIKDLKDIKPEHFSGFIAKGLKINGAKYDPKSAGTYYSQVQKLQHAYNKQNGTNYTFADKDYKQFCGQSEKKRQQMPRDTHDKIIAKAYSNRYVNGLAYDIARALGLRVREITNLRIKDFKIDKDGKLISIDIYKSKNGRCRTIKAEQLTPRQQQIVLKVYNHFKDSRGQNDRLFIRKTQTYEKTFSRIRDGLTGDKYKHCGVHSMRKEFAKDFFTREYFEKGRDKKEVLQELTQLLGHNRLEVLRDYLDDMYDM